VPRDRKQSRPGLKNFAAIPHRAFGDRRLGEPHLRVLLAICRAVSPETWLALITQERIAERTRYHRNTVGRKVRDLEDWGYFTIHRRGRQRHGLTKGRFKTHVYEIHYVQLPADPEQTEQGMAHAPPDKCNTVHHQHGAGSDSLESDIQTVTREVLADGESNAISSHIEPLDSIVRSARNDMNPTPQSTNRRPHQIQTPTAAATNDNRMDVAEVIKLADEFDELCEEAERLGVDRHLLVRLRSARATAAAYVSFEKLCDIALFARSEPGNIKDQIRFMIDQYEAIVSVYMRRS